MIIVGVCAAMIFFRVFHQKVWLSAKVFNFSLFVGVAAIILGCLSAVLFQSRYSFLENGEFVCGVGATFYGGLIGCLLFLSVLKKFEYTASVYWIVCGIWRFFIESSSHAPTTAVLLELMRFRPRSLRLFFDFGGHWADLPVQICKKNLRESS